MPGDRIVGIITPGEGITIYPIQSPALSAFDNEPEPLARRAGIRGIEGRPFPPC